MRWMCWGLLLGLLSGMALGCPVTRRRVGRPRLPADAGVVDAGQTARDANVPDAALQDAGPADVQGADAGASDAGEGSSDAGIITGPTPVTIWSWNIEQFPKTSATPGRVRTILEDLEPDLVGVQEITDPADFIALDDLLTDYEGIQVSDPGNSLRVGLLYRPERIRIVDSFELFENDSFAFPRPLLWADVEVLNDAGQVVFDFEFLVLHLKARGDNESRERREAACARIEEWIRSRVSFRDEKDYVVVGDWNDSLTDIPDLNVFIPFYEPAGQYSFLTQSLAEGGASTFIPFESMIDHIMVTNDALEEYGAGATRVVQADFMYSSYESQVSDHRPVQSRFVIR